LRGQEKRLISEQDIINSIKVKRAKIFGISVITVSAGNALLIAKVIRSYHRDANIVFGGMHPTLYGEHFIPEPEVDAIILGEGNQTIVELIERCQHKEEWHTIKGIMFKDSNGDVIRTEKKSCTHLDTDVLPYAAYDLICQESLPLVPRVFSVKGCPYHCAFCSCNAFYSIAYDDYKVCYRDPTKVVDEVEYLYKQYHMAFYCFGDLTFMSDKQSALSICKELIKRNLSHVKWWCQTTIGRLNADDLALMKKAGCVQVGLGVENSSQQALDIMGKPVRFDAAEEQCQLIREAGIAPITYWILGLGEESYESANNLIKRICYFIESGLTELSHIGVPVPYPGSALFNDPQAHGLEITGMDFNNYWMNSDELGYSVPAVRTKYLSADHIYALWQYALIAATRCYEKRDKRK
jgi:radical SAM superfamily enzyme YgiQ (UPF0313 family)